jgi:hypothetical protein
MLCRVVGCCVACVALSCASTEAGAEAGCEVHVVGSALINGTARAEYVKLGPRQEQALVALRLEQVDQPSEGSCSGLLIAARTVLTAKHCAPDATTAGIRVAFAESTGQSVFETRARIVAAHPEADVMLLELEQDPSQAMEVVPVPVARALPTGFAPASLVQLGGLGTAADGGSGERTFLTEQVLELDDASIVVGAGELGGACFGDSGGPLLARGDNGLVYALGVLRTGTVSCVGRDSYARIDGLTQWLSANGQLVDEPDPPQSRDYVSLGHEGRCFDERAVWFDTAGLQARVCSGEYACGWDRAARGYRCVRAADDTCAGIDDVGQCDQGIARRCVQGRIETNPCASCGFVCERSPKSGRPACLPAQDADGP